MDVLVLTVKEPGGCVEILEMSVNGDSTYLQGIADGIESEIMTWLPIPTLPNTEWARASNRPNKIYQIQQWSAVDLS